jgi:hypothetical protein
MVAYLLNMPSGFPGALSRWEHATVEAQPINTTTPPLSYGIIVVMDAATGTIRQPQTADTAGFYGLNVRPYPTQGFGPAGSGALSAPLPTPAVPPTSGATDVMRRGYMYCLLGGATAAVKGAGVNVWTGATAGAQVQGNVTAVAPAAGSCVALPNATFMSAADANGIVEVSFNI